MGNITRGKIAELTGINKETLRYYESINLIDKKTGKNNYRIYSESDIERIIFIQKMQMSGFKLVKIKNILDILEGRTEGGRDEEIMKIIEERLAEIDNAVCELLKMKDLILHTLDNAGSESSSDCFLKKFAEKQKKA
jgi:DNA-binding transcriptional MerR regulator